MSRQSAPRPNTHAHFAPAASAQPEGEGLLSELRATYVLHLEHGEWKIVQIHWSLPGNANVEILGMQLTLTLEQLEKTLQLERPDLSESTAADGTVTLVFTDVVDSTVLTARLGDKAWMETVRRHHEAVRECAEVPGGAVVETQGDGALLAFGSARRAVSCAKDIQAAVRRARPSPGITGERRPDSQRSPNRGPHDVPKRGRADLDSPFDRRRTSRLICLRHHHCVRTRRRIDMDGVSSPARSSIAERPDRLSRRRRRPRKRGCMGRDRCSRDATFGNADVGEQRTRTDQIGRLHDLVRRRRLTPDCDCSGRAARHRPRVSSRGACCGERRGRQPPPRGRGSKCRERAPARADPQGSGVAARRDCDLRRGCGRRTDHGRRRPLRRGARTQQMPRPAPAATRITRESCPRRFEAAATASTSKIERDRDPLRSRPFACQPEPPEASRPCPRIVTHAANAPGRIRTSDPRIRSPPLCPLSYGRVRRE